MFGRPFPWISSPHGSVVCLPYSSWFHQLPQRPIAWASRRPGATASIISRTLFPERRTTQAPASTPNGIAPQIPSPPDQTANGPYQWAWIAGSWFQLVMSW